MPDETRPTPLRHVRQDVLGSLVPAGFAFCGIELREGEQAAAWAASRQVYRAHLLPAERDGYVMPEICDPCRKNEQVKFEEEEARSVEEKMADLGNLYDYGKLIGAAGFEFKDGRSCGIAEFERGFVVTNKGYRIDNGAEHLTQINYSRETMYGFTFLYAAFAAPESFEADKVIFHNALSEDCAARLQEYWEEVVKASIRREGEAAEAIHEDCPGAERKEGDAGA